MLRDVTLGRLLDTQKEALTPITAVIGKNGVGKTTLFDAFRFLADALKFNVETACEAHGRGGFEKIRSQGGTGPIGFEVYYREHRNAKPITYQIAIDADRSGRPYVLLEHLKEEQNGQKYAPPFSFFMLVDGSGVAWKENQEGYQIDDIQTVLKPIKEVKFKKTEVQEDSEITTEIEGPGSPIQLRSPRCPRIHQKSRTA